jgi:hypothetical protein
MNWSKFVYVTLVRLYLRSQAESRVVRKKAANVLKKQEQERVHWLVTTGVKPGENTAQLQAASSCTAASFGEVHILKVLLEQGADIHQRK